MEKKGLRVLLAARGMRLPSLHAIRAEARNIDVEAFKAEVRNAMDEASAQKAKRSERRGEAQALGCGGEVSEEHLQATEEALCVTSVSLTPCFALLFRFCTPCLLHSQRTATAGSSDGR